MGDAAFNYSFLDQRFALQYKSDQQKVQLFMIFSLLTITIACLGLIGMMGFSLARRSKEIGIRRVFGANSFAVIYLFSKEYGCVILIGIIIAIPVANYLIKDWLVNFPYRLNLSAIYFIIPTGSLLLISTILIFLSAYKASKTNPANVLRSE